MRQFIAIILQGLTDKDPSDSAVAEKAMNLLDGQQNPVVFVEDLRREIQRIKDFRGDREPFYHLYLSVAHFLQRNHNLAKNSLSAAIQGFRIQGFSLNEALGEWLFGIIHFEKGDFERAQRAWESATAIFQKLISQCEEESKYRKAKDYTWFLAQLESCHDLARASLTLEGNSGNDSSVPDLSSARFHYERLDLDRSLLEKYHSDLGRKAEYLKRHKMRIPPTLVATRFYLYKTLTPSHSVYSPVPVSLTDGERKAYEELLGKVGAFEVVEQLVELEREFEPDASRESLLEKINKDWDEDVKKY
jgi:tetratricopeptide (TPR) repeat protein